MIYKNILLKKFNTFGLTYRASCMIRIRTEKEAVELFKGTNTFVKPLLILGGGSNILFTSDYQGTILYPQLKGIKIEALEPNRDSVIVSSGAGVVWDDFVGWSVNKGFGGAENLSLIPGKVGATPVQNIGAYGVEIRDLILKVRTVSTDNGSIRYFTNEECKFGYRNSIFKNELKGKFLVTRVYFRLATKPSVNLSYELLMEETDKLGGVTLENVRQGIINIRRRKLPDPELTGNAGSFFKNPVVKSSYASDLKKEYPGMPVYNEREGYVKLASGWLIDKCGWKGIRRGNAGVHEKQALVLVNYGNASGLEIYNLSEEIKQSVYSKFGVSLEREVEVVGTI